ncbi:MAG: hypothetical protein GX235_00160 [Clostridiales bacterium]|nr:hypothetical protein [Clostridiales bacterium]
MLDYRIRQFRRQLQESRFRLHNMYEALAEPLYDMLFVATKDVWRISTNGSCIYFDPDWLKNLGEVEIDFILSHELMHIKLGHIERPAYYLGDRYHLAADIVANGKLNTYGWNYVKIPHIGKIRYETYLPTVSGALIESTEAVRYIPIDPSTLGPAKRRQFMIDSDQWWDRKDDRGESGTIVLSPEDDDPDDLEYSGPGFGGKFKFNKEEFPTTGGGGSSSNQSDENEKTFENTDKNNLRQAIHMLRQETRSNDMGTEEGFVERSWRDKTVKTLDWKSILNHFVQEEVNDYSFTPPDRRMQDSDFFLPDYNVYQETVRDVYFMVDASGSITDEMLFMAYAEIKQALEQFNGNLNGVVAFFDTRIHKVISFGSVEDIRNMKPYGGGGTDYNCIFRYINGLNKMNPPTSIVIITDGEGIYPDISVTNNIPVLWLLTGDMGAPWGKSIKVK